MAPSSSKSHDLVLDMVFKLCCIKLISEMVSSAEMTDPVDSSATRLCPVVVVGFDGTLTKLAASDKFDELDEVTSGVGGNE